MSPRVGSHDYKSISLRNTDFYSDFAELLADCYRWSDRNWAKEHCKGKIDSNNLHLLLEILERTEDDTEATLINLDQSKTFERVEYLFLAAVLGTAGFKVEIHRGRGILYEFPAAVKQVNWKRSGPSWSKGKSACVFPLFPVLLSIVLQPLLRRCRDGRIHSVLRGISLTGWLEPKVSTYTNEVTIFMSRSLDITEV